MCKYANYEHHANFKILPVSFAHLHIAHLKTTYLLHLHICISAHLHIDIFALLPFKPYIATNDNEFFIALLF
jgi:hypothetical protein